MPNIKYFEKQIGWKAVILRYIDLSLSIYQLYFFFEENHMLGVRITQMQINFREMVELLSLQISN